MFRTILFLSASIPTLSIIGCITPDEPGPPPPVAVAEPAYYEPGYYYVPEYYDTRHVYHGRSYYYYDGHHYEPRAHVPAGINVRIHPEYAHRAAPDRGHIRVDHR